MLNQLQLIKIRLNTGFVIFCILLFSPDIKKAFPNYWEGFLIDYCKIANLYYG